MHRLTLSAAASLVLALPTLAQDPGTAMATFIDRDGLEVGSVILAQGRDAITIVGDLAGLTPGEHGFHFHETGDCDGTTGFESAGSHVNPDSHQHGLENPEGPHAGDLPNVTAGQDGTAAVNVTSATISLDAADPAYVFDADGTALVVHAAADDQVTDPSGNSGDRVACAVIEANTAP